VSNLWGPLHFTYNTIAERPLKKKDLSQVRDLVAEASKCEVTESPYEESASMGSPSGTLDIQIDGEMKPIYGVLRTSLTEQKFLECKLEAVKSLKSFVRSYKLLLMQLDSLD